MKVGAVNDLLGINGKDLICHGMAHMFCNAHHMSKGLSGIRGEIRIILLVIDEFPKMESEEGANVNSGTCSMLEGNRVDG